ncbi:peptidylprolyl isomerase [Niabella insulamsoli]|uniref:peptidylprolyl isomerase n=1 Tax=Niabella insulamsoli TaxID=3144874 RepID=UPI0031FE3FDB
MRFIFYTLVSVLLLGCSSSKRISKRDYRKDVLLQTNYGNMQIRLSDQTPLHRDNFLKLVKSGYYDGLLFHRVINHFMIQAGDPNSRNARPGEPLGDGGPDYTIPAEFRPNLFHHKGVVAAAREGNDVNPQKASSGSQFYIVQGKVWTPGGLDSFTRKRLNGKVIPDAQREAYTTLGGTPHLDQHYTVFGAIVDGMQVLDKIAAVPTSRSVDKDRPLRDVVILKATLIKRKKQQHLISKN